MHRYARRPRSDGRFDIVDRLTGGVVRIVKTKSAAMQVVAKLNARALRDSKGHRNPLPSKWTVGRVRVNGRGEVQVMLTGKAAKQAATRATGRRK